MKFKFTLQRESLELLNRLLRAIHKFWATQRIFFYCDTSGIRLYPESISELSPTYCEIFFASPSNTVIPKLEQANAAGDVGSSYRQFFETFLIASEKPESRIIFSPENFAELAKTIALMAALKVESSAIFKLTQEVIGNYIKVRKSAERA